MISVARDIIREVAERNRIHPNELLGPGRDDRLVKARVQIAYALRTRKWSTRRIADVLNRDFSTVVHLLQTRNPDGSRRFRFGSLKNNPHKGTRI